MILHIHRVLLLAQKFQETLQNNFWLSGINLEPFRMEQDEVEKRHAPPMGIGVGHRDNSSQGLHTCGKWYSLKLFWIILGIINFTNKVIFNSRNYLKFK